MNKYIFSVLCVLFVVPLGNASIYSTQGIGLKSVFPSGSFAGRAGLGIAINDTTCPNPLQPASNAILTGVKFQIGMQLQQRGVTDSIGNSGNQSELDFSGFLLSTPFYKQIRLGISMQPYRISRSKSFSVRQYGGNVYWEKYDRTGGLNEYSITLASRFRNFAFGIQNSYIAGTISSGWRVNFENNSMMDGWHVVSEKYSGWKPMFGLVYSVGNLQLSSNFSPAIKLEKIVEIRDSLTTTTSITKKSIELPFTTAIGISYLRYPFVIGYDIYYESQSNSITSVKESMRNGLWLEYSKSYGLLDPYWQKIIYRTGVQFSNLGVNSANGKEVSEITTSIGLGLPLISSKNRVDVAVGFTKRGSKDKNFSEEKVIWTSLSFVILENWFDRPIPKRKK